MFAQRVETSISAKRHFLNPLPHPAPTFPDKDPSVRAVVQNEAVTRLQRALGERVLRCHQSDRHGSGGIGHLQGGGQEGGWKSWQSEESAAFCESERLLLTPPPPGLLSKPNTVRAGMFPNWCQLEIFAYKWCKYEARHFVFLEISTHECTFLKRSFNTFFQHHPKDFPAPWKIYQIFTFIV